MIAEQNYNTRYDLGKIKESLIALFYNMEDLTRLVPHCFDTPYIEGMTMGHDSAIFVETYLTKAVSQRIKEVGIDICVLCHKDSIGLSESDKEYYQSKGIYGNRIDSSIQVIHSSILAPRATDDIKEALSVFGKYSIGGLTLSSEKEPLKPYSPGAGFYGKCLSYTYQSFHQRK